MEVPHYRVKDVPGKSPILVTDSLVIAEKLFHGMERPIAHALNCHQPLMQALEYMLGQQKLIIDGASAKGIAPEAIERIKVGVASARLILAHAKES